MKTKLLVLISCMATAGVVNALTVTLNCKDQTNHNLCNMNTASDAGSVQGQYSSVQSSVEQVIPPPQNVGTGQVSGATVQGVLPDASVQAQKKQAAFIEMVSMAPAPEVAKYTFGKTERKIFSCQEMSPIRPWAKNPGNTVGKIVIGQTGLTRGIVDSYGWYETPFTVTDSNGKETTAFGGASASRQAVYKNGVFDHWSGWPVAQDMNNLAPGWGWNFAQVGMCESSI